MEVARIWTDASPDPAMIRICGEVTYNSQPGTPETYWFDVPQRYADDVTTTGNPWAVALLPLAATIGEPLSICRSVDPLLLEHLTQLLRIWRCWYPGLSAIPIVAPQDDVPVPARDARTVAFFSGGVDSFFTLLRDRTPGRDRPIDDLLAIWGFDVPLTNAAAFARMRAVLQNVANQTGKELITVATNLRQTRWAAADWGHLSHACGLVSVALMLEPRWTRVLIASSYGYAHLQPWGSHPLTDPLLSTSRTTVVHDGAEVNRVEKTGMLSRSDVAMQALRVCWKSRSDMNCGRCEKCYRTMLTLWLLGRLEHCPTFPAKSFDLRSVDRIFCPSSGATAFILEIRELARSKGRGDVARAIDRAIARSRRLVRAQAGLKKLGRAIGSTGWGRPLSALLRRVEWRLFRDALR